LIAEEFESYKRIRKLLPPSWFRLGAQEPVLNNDLDEQEGRNRVFALNYFLLEQKKLL